MKNTGSFSRRSFLKGLPLGALGIAALGFMSSKVLASASNRRKPKFKNGSIFTPRDKDIEI
jgi:hypothetical protein